MAVREIVLLGDPVLRQKSKKIHRVDDAAKQLVQDLADTVKATPNGAGLSAPQIGIPLRAIVTYVDDKLKILINPEVVEESEDVEEAMEGCLSIPGWYGPVQRPLRVTVRGLSKSGRPTKFKSEGLEARCFLHEIDHLNGVLFIDRLTDRSRLQKVDSEEEEEELEEEQVFA